MVIFSDLPDILSVNQAAEVLSVDRKTIEREIKRGNLKAFKVGRCVRITKAALLEYTAGARS